LPLLRWLTEPSDAGERQRRAYQVVAGQQDRLVKFLRQDRDSPPKGLADKGSADPEVRNPAVTDDWDASKAVEGAERGLAELARLASQDGYATLGKTPAREYLFNNYFPEGNYASFHMYSEMGSHPPGTVNILFAFDPDTGRTSFDLQAMWVDRAKWAAFSLRLMFMTCEIVGRGLGWEDWLRERIAPWTHDVAPLLEEVKRRSGGWMRAPSDLS
jgi:hypothetical protein